MVLSFRPFSSGAGHLPPPGRPHAFGNALWLELRCPLSCNTQNRFLARTLVCSAVLLIQPPTSQPSAASSSFCRGSTRVGAHAPCAASPRPDRDTEERVSACGLRVQRSGEPEVETSSLRLEQQINNKYITIKLKRNTKTNFRP